MASWHIYQGTEKPHDGIDRLEEIRPPRWRRMDAPGWRGETYQASDEEKDLVNAAIYLRRPLLITGLPGTGKSSLAHAVARELELEPVLVWPISTRSTLQEGLYRYDAVGRLQAASLAQRDASAPAALPDFLRLGPLGTALLPSKRPRVLLVDEIDKSDVDLPNDLLHVFEDGEYEIPEISRLGGAAAGLKFRPADDGEPVAIPRGRVRCTTFPLVFLTSNGEREFPPAFLRRCIRLHVRAPDAKRLEDIVRAHLGEDALAQAMPLIERFLAGGATLATDQLLNALFMTTTLRERGEEAKQVIDALLQSIVATP